MKTLKTTIVVLGVALSGCASSAGPAQPVPETSKTSTDGATDTTTDGSSNTTANVATDHTEGPDCAALSSTNKLVGFTEFVPTCIEANVKADASGYGLFIKFHTAPGSEENLYLSYGGRIPSDGESMELFGNYAQKERLIAGTNSAETFSGYGKGTVNFQVVPRKPGDRVVLNFEIRQFGVEPFTGYVDTVVSATE